MGVACNYRPLIAQMARQHQTWNARMGFGKHKWSYDVERYMTSSPLGITHDRMTSDMALSYGPLATNMVGQCQESHGLITHGHHTPSNIIGHFMPSSAIGSTLDQTTLGVACIHRTCKAYTIEQLRRGTLLSPLDITQDQTMFGVACLHRPCEAHIVG